MRLIIDRVEGDYAICFNPENNDTFQVDKYMLPAGIKDGDVVVSKDRDLVIDKKYKEVLLNRINNLKSKVWKKIMFDIFFDALIDALKLIPFLFLAFLLIEYFEHKLSNKSLNAIKNTKKGPLFGSLFGLLPQCGFSVIATNLYVTRVITLGTLISIYLSTSDEMLPILIAKNVSFSIIGKILFFKFIVGLISGIVIDLFFCRDKNKSDYHICSDDHCDCEHNIFKSACIHTLKTFIFILVINIVLNLLFEVCGYDMISKIFMKNSFLSVFISSFIGLIPNCAASIIICELFLNDIIGFGALISGLLAGSGVAIILLFKSNNNIKDSFKILGLLYFISSFVGLIIYLFEL